MKKYIAILLMILTSVSFIQGQTNPMVAIHNNAVNIPKTPEVATMERYKAYPISNNVGIPDISIPIYTIKSGQLEVPIILSYHLGGIKVEDIASWVGLGWNLQSHGYISRELRGRPDEDGLLTQKATHSFIIKKNGKQEKVTLPIPLSEDGTLSSVTDYGSESENVHSYFTKLEYNTIDSQSDIYKYNAPGISGSFAYNLVNKGMIKFPYSDNKIQRDILGDLFVITSDNGTIYTFKDVDVMYTASAASSFKYTSNWLLSSIESADRKDRIDFIYTDQKFYNNSKACPIVWEGYGTNDLGQPTAIFLYNQVNLSNVTVQTHERLLSQIRFNEGSVIFELDATKRKDERDYALKNIVVLDRDKKQVKKANLNYSYYESGTKREKKELRLKLDSLLIYGSSDKDAPLLYNFSYNGTQLFPTDSYSQDYWGFYNGVSNIHLSGIMPSGAKSVKAKREPNEYNMSRGILKKIDYPTGGYSSFITEANRIGDKLYGGLRIARIRSKAESSSPEIITTYKYNDASTVFDVDVTSYKFRMYYSDVVNAPSDISPWREYYTQSPFSGLGLYMGSPVRYNQVIKEELSQGKVLTTQYRYDASWVFSNSLSGGSSMPYNRGVFQRHYVDWASNKLIKEEHYNSDNKQPIKIVSYDYATLRNEEHLIGKNIISKWLKDNTLYIFDENEQARASFYYDTYWMYINTGYQILQRKTEQEYDKQSKQYISNTTYYDYDIFHKKRDAVKNLLLKEEVSSTSENDSLYTVYKYPHDFSTQQVYADMVSKNMFNVPLEMTVYKSKSFSAKKEINRQKYEYGYFPFIRPQKKLSSNNGQDLTVEFEYKSYNNKGKLEEYTGKDNVGTVLLWDVNNSPIAEINNTTFAEIETALKSQKLTTTELLKYPTSGLSEEEFRKSLPNSHVTTYKHKQLVGISSIATPSNILTHYEYDHMGRLQYVRNHQGKLISKYEYHYRPLTKFTEVKIEGHNEYYLYQQLSIPVSINGSGSNAAYTYNWILKDPKTDKILTTSTDERFVWRPSELGSFVLSCQIKDKSNNQLYHDKLEFKIGAPPKLLMGELTVGYGTSLSKEYDFGKHPYEFKVDFTGGSYSYKTHWYMENASTQKIIVDEILDLGTQSLHKQIEQSGNIKGKVVITDNYTKEQVSKEFSFHITEPPMFDISNIVPVEPSFGLGKSHRFWVRIMQPGSHKIIYKWELLNSKNTVLQSGTEISFTPKFTERGDMTLVCTATDIARFTNTSVRKEMRFKVIEDYPLIINILPEDKDQYVYQDKEVYKLGIQDGTGNYTYNWSLRNAQSKLLLSATTSTFNARFTEIGKHTLSCILYDKGRNETKTVNRVLMINKPPIEVTNKKETNYSNQIRCSANISVYEKTSVKFRVRGNGQGNGTSIGYNVGGRGGTAAAYKLPLNEDIVLELLPNLSYTIEFTITKGSESGSYVDCSIDMIEIVSSNRDTMKIGNDNGISARLYY